MAITIQLMCAALHPAFAKYDMLYEMLLPVLCKGGGLQIAANLRPVAVTCVNTIVNLVIGHVQLNKLIANSKNFIRFMINVGAFEQLGNLIKSRMNNDRYNYKSIVVKTLVRYYNMTE